MRYCNFEESNSLLVSEEAEKGASKMIERIKNGSLYKETLPNSYEVYNGAIEEENYRSFCKFLKSRNGKLVINMIEQEEGVCNGSFG